MQMDCGYVLALSDNVSITEPITSGSHHTLAVHVDSCVLCCMGTVNGPTHEHWNDGEYKGNTDDIHKDRKPHQGNSKGDDYLNVEMADDGVVVIWNHGGCRFGCPDSNE